MKALIVDNVHLFKDEHGNYYASSIYSYDFLKRYLNVFEQIRFLGKVRPLEDDNLSKYKLVSGPNVEIYEIPWYQGFKQMIKKIFKLVRIYRKSCKGCDCYIFRVAQIESFFTYIFGKKRNVPFAIEVVNDPETFNDVPKMLKKFSIKMLKKMAKKAAGASYVTKSFLQKKYPVKNPSINFQENYSSVDLELSDINTIPMDYDTKKPFRIVHVSNAINSDIKGHYTFIKTIKKIIEKGYIVEAVCIGDGNKLHEYQEFVEKSGLSDYIKFLGRLNSKSAVLNELKNSNLMLLPTQMEGLPRTIIEAMAVGLPCLSTPIAGIPEILEEKYLFDPFDFNGFADEIIRLMNNVTELKQMSLRNIEISKEFTKDKLEIRRNSFYNKLKEKAIREKR